MATRSKMGRRATTINFWSPLQSEKNRAQRGEGSVWKCPHRIGDGMPPICIRGHACVERLVDLLAPFPFRQDMCGGVLKPCCLDQMP